MHETNGTTPQPSLYALMARVKSHQAQAAYMAACARMPREQRMVILAKLQSDFVDATNMDVSQPDVWNALALLHLTEGGYEGAREIFQAIHKWMPDYLDAMNNLGLAELALGNEEAAISAFQKVILCDRNHTEALSNYGVVLLRHAMYDAAIRAFEAAVEKGGRGCAFAWGGLAIARGAVGLMEEAENAALEAERIADPVNKAKFSMLLTSLQARHVTENIRSGDGVRMIDDHVLRLRALARQIRSSSASTALGAVLRLRHEHAWEETGNRNFGAEAAERLVEALEKDSSDATAWVQLALLQIGTGDYSAARVFATQGVTRNSNVEAGWNALAVANQLSDERDEATKSFSKAIEAVRINYSKKRHGNVQERRADGGVGDEDPILFPNPAPAEEEVMPTGDDDDLNDAGRSALAALYNNWGNLKRQEGRSFSEALHAYERSLKLGGENAIVYNNLALLYISAGRFEDAGDMLEHARKLDPQFECALSNQLKLRALVRRQERENGGKEEPRSMVIENDLPVDEPDEDKDDSDMDMS